VRHRALLPLICHSAVCTLLAGAFLFVSVPPIWSALRAFSFGPALPFQSTNRYMAKIMGVQNGSELLTRAFSALPAERPVLVVSREGNDESILLGYLVNYFAFPREARSLTIDGGTDLETELQKIERSSLGAIFFCGIDPPAGLQPAIALGQQLVIVPTSAVTANK
jgi:hypothetical protein